MENICFAGMWNCFWGVLELITDISLLFDALQNLSDIYDYGRHKIFWVIGMYRGRKGQTNCFCMKSPSAKRWNCQLLLEGNHWRGNYWWWKFPNDCGRGKHCWSKTHSVSQCHIGSTRDTECNGNRCLGAKTNHKWNYHVMIPLITNFIKGLFYLEKVHPCMWELILLIIN